MRSFLKEISLEFERYIDNTMRKIKKDLEGFME